MEKKQSTCKNHTKKLNMKHKNETDKSIECDNKK